MKYSHYADIKFSSAPSNAYEEVEKAVIDNENAIEAESIDTETYSLELYNFQKIDQINDLKKQLPSLKQKIQDEKDIIEDNKDQLQQHLADLEKRKKNDMQDRYIKEKEDDIAKAQADVDKLLQDIEDAKRRKQKLQAELDALKNRNKLIPTQPTLEDLEDKVIRLEEEANKAKADADDKRKAAEDLEAKVKQWRDGEWGQRNIPKADTVLLRKIWDKLRADLGEDIEEGDGEMEKTERDTTDPSSSSSILPDGDINLRTLLSEMLSPTHPSKAEANAKLRQRLDDATQDLMGALAQLRIAQSALEDARKHRGEEPMSILQLRSWLSRLKEKKANAEYVESVLLRRFHQPGIFAADMSANSDGTDLPPPLMMKENMIGVTFHSLSLTLSPEYAKVYLRRLEQAEKIHKRRLTKQLALMDAKEEKKQQRNQKRMIAEAEGEEEEEEEEEEDEEADEQDLDQMDDPLMQSLSVSLSDPPLSPSALLRTAIPAGPFVPYFEAGVSLFLMIDVFNAGTARTKLFSPQASAAQAMGEEEEGMGEFDGNAMSQGSIIMRNSAILGQSLDQMKMKKRRRNDRSGDDDDDDDRVSFGSGDVSMKDTGRNATGYNDETEQDYQNIQNPSSSLSLPSFSVAPVEESFLFRQPVDALFIHSAARHPIPVELYALRNPAHAGAVVSSSSSSSSSSFSGRLQSGFGRGAAMNGSKPVLIGRGSFDLAQLLFGKQKTESVDRIAYQIHRRRKQEKKEKKRKEEMENEAKKQLEQTKKRRTERKDGRMMNTSTISEDDNENDEYESFPSSSSSSFDDDVSSGDIDPSLNGHSSLPPPVSGHPEWATFGKQTLSITLHPAGIVARAAAHSAMAMGGGADGEFLPADGRGGNTAGRGGEDGSVSPPLFGTGGGRTGGNMFDLNSSVLVTRSGGEGGMTVVTPGERVGMGETISDSLSTPPSANTEVTLRISVDSLLPLHMCMLPNEWAIVEGDWEEEIRVRVQERLRTRHRLRKMMRKKWGKERRNKKRLLKEKEERRMKQSLATQSSLKSSRGESVTMNKQKKQEGEEENDAKMKKMHIQSLSVPIPRKAFQLGLREIQQLFEREQEAVTQRLDTNLFAQCQTCKESAGDRNGEMMNELVKAASEEADELWREAEDFRKQQRRLYKQRNSSSGII